MPSLLEDEEDHISPTSAAADEYAGKLPQLLELVREVNAEMDLNALVRLIMSGARELVSAGRCTLYMIDYDSKELWSLATDINEDKRRIARGTRGGRGARRASVVTLQGGGSPRGSGGITPRAGATAATPSPKASEGHASGESEIRIGMGAGLAGECARTGDILNIADAYSDDRFNKDVDRNSSFTTKSMLCVPIFDEEMATPVAILQLINKTGFDQRYNEADEQLIGDLATHCRSAIHKCTLFHQIGSLIQSGQMLNTVMDMDSLMVSIMDQARQMLVCERCALFVTDEVTQRIWTIDASAEVIEIAASKAMDRTKSGKMSSSPGAALERMYINIGEGAAGSVAKTGQLLNLSFPEDEGQVDVTHDAKEGEALRSLLCMPITSEKGRLMGAVEIVNKISGGTDSGAARFSAQDQELLSAFCRQAVSAIEKCQMFNKLRSLLDSAKELGPSALPCPDSHCRTTFVGRERLRSWSLAFSRAATLTVAVDALGTAALRALTVSGRKSPTEACRKREIGRSRSEPYGAHITQHDSLTPEARP